MSNSYFRFKHFTVHQDRSAMKVCTDSCIQGAWTSSKLKSFKNILDIGTGTGLLTLMLAQNSTAIIDGIELDRESFLQASENIKESPWNNRIHIVEGDARYYSFKHKFDFIICNPPFFESDLQSPDLKKNKSKHEISFTLEDLIKIVSANLEADGAFSVLLPFHRTEYFVKLATANGFFLQEKILLRQTPRHEPFRSICLFGYQKPKEIMVEELTIKNADGKNSPEYESLMKEYYL
jgi:tRNA1Val (adenine37-N6)-methyltransferase